MICENFTPFRHSLRFDKRDETSRKITAQLEHFFGIALTSKMTPQKTSIIALINDTSRLIRYALISQ